MPPKLNDHAVRRLRTFADDLARAKAKKDGVAPVPSLPSAPPPTVPVGTLDSTINALTSELDEQVASAPTPPDIPPFHSIRATSAEESAFSDEKTIRENNQRPKAVPKAPPPPLQAEPTIIPGKEQGLDLTSATKKITNHHSSPFGKNAEIFDTEEASRATGEGSIVTDRKRNKFHLFPAIATALKGWFGDKKTTITENRAKAHPKVERPEERADIITAAAKDSKLAPKSDYNLVSERLSGAERVATKNPELSIKAPEAMPAPSWQHLVETTEEAGVEKTTVPKPPSPPPLPAVEPAAIASIPEVAKPLVPIAPPPPPAPAITLPAEAIVPAPVAPVEVPTQEPASRWDHFEEQTTEQPVVPEIPATPEPPPAPVFVAPPTPIVEVAPKAEFKPPVQPPPVVQVEPQPTPAEGVAPAFARQPVPAYRLNRLGQPVAKNNSAQYLTLAAVVIVAIVLGVGTSVWWFTRTAEPTIVDITPSPNQNLLNTAATNSIELSGTKFTFYTELLAAISSGPSGVVELYPTVGGVVATPELVFSTLNTRAPGSFLRAITTITFGGYNASDPFIVMNFTSFDTAFGGMLSWETQILSDLAPLFGPGANVQVVDSKVNNRDIRALVNPQGEDVLIYGFIDRNTLLITKSRTAYSAIAPLIR